jgi:hypothetical protein
MKVNGSAVLHADRQRVYDSLNDPTVLAGAIPGCQSLVPLGGDRYRMSVTAGVASIKGTYDGEVVLTDQQPPESFTLRAKGAGAPGTVDATCRVSLTTQPDGSTRLDYDADAVVGGVVGGVGQRMLQGVSKKMAGQFFGNVDDVLQGRRPAQPAAAAAVSAAGSLGEGTSSRMPLAHPGLAPSRTSPLAAAAVGAVIALAGVVVGWRIGRRR